MPSTHELVLADPEPGRTVGERTEEGRRRWKTDGSGRKPCNGLVDDRNDDLDPGSDIRRRRLLRRAVSDTSAFTVGMTVVAALYRGDVAMRMRIGIRNCRRGVGRQPQATMHRAWVERSVLAGDEGEPAREKRPYHACPRPSSHREANLERARPRASVAL